MEFSFIMFSSTRTLQSNHMLPLPRIHPKGLLPETCEAGMLLAHPAPSTRRIPRKRPPAHPPCISRAAHQTSEVAAGLILSLLEARSFAFSPAPAHRLKLLPESPGFAAWCMSRISSSTRCRVRRPCCDSSAASSTIRRIMAWAAGSHPSLVSGGAGRRSCGAGRCAGRRRWMDFWGLGRRRTCCGGGVRRGTRCARRDRPNGGSTCG